ncbi:MAG: DUF2157 domain-containing protein [Candidatus Obscuribacterales bacterium]|nr:DUF2157 domain-containing protein [Candidatus Obscuribacterales bacterium]
MERARGGRRGRFVVEEIESWCREGLIEEALAERLKGLYRSDSGAVGSGLAAAAFSIIGAVLVGLGVILFLASNWHAMGYIAKFFCIGTAMVVTNYFGWQLRYSKEASRPRLGNALLLLGGIFYGAAIWLISQMLNIDLALGQGLFLWLIGSLLSTLALANLPLAYLSSALLAVWSFSFDEWLQLASGDPWHFLLFVFSFGAILGLAHRFSSRGIGWIGLLSGGIWLVGRTGISGLAIYMYGLALFAAYLFIQDHAEERVRALGVPYLSVSMIASLSTLLAFTSYPYTFAKHGLQYSGFEFSALFGTALLMLLLVTWRSEKFRIESISAMVLLVVPQLLMGVGEADQRTVYNLILLAVLAGLIYSGAFRQKNVALINYALVYFVLDVLVRYFDFFFTMMDRSIFFVTGGVILMIVGSLVESERRRLIKGLEPGDLQEGERI